MTTSIYYIETTSIDLDQYTATIVVKKSDDDFPTHAVATVDLHQVADLGGWDYDYNPLVHEVHEVLDLHFDEVEYEVAGYWLREATLLCAPCVATALPKMNNVEICPAA